MLLSFERPAPAGLPLESSREPAPVLVASADLENCIVVNETTGITGCRPIARGRQLITVKIGRAHGGCLGTRSR
jgi:hypothetical protein